MNGQYGMGIGPPRQPAMDVGRPQMDPQQMMQMLMLLMEIINRRKGEPEGGMPQVNPDQMGAPQLTLAQLLQGGGR